MDNNTSKYLQYAVGEIVLVMLGILLALQVSNWNSDRLDRINEQKLLANIHRDFIVNKEQFELVKTINYRTQAAFASMIDLFPFNSDTAKFSEYWRIANRIESHTYNAYSGTVNMIINSNSLNLIQNEDLQAYLVSWNDVLTDYLEEEISYYEMMRNTYNPLLLTSFDWIGDDNPIITERMNILLQNMTINRKNYHNGIIVAIENEPIEKYINEIILLSSSSD